MTTPDTLPAWLADALDKPLVGPVSLVLLGGLFILFAAALIDRWVSRELERHRLHAKIARPEAEFESAAEHWHKPPVQAWGDEPREVGK